jgi:hypothetical protein
VRAARSALKLAAAALALACAYGGLGLAQPATPPPAVAAPPPEAAAPVVQGEPPADQADADAPVTDHAPAKPPEPVTRPRRTAAVIQALDKVTAETMRFEVQVNQPVRYKDLVFTVHACEENAADEPQKGAFAHLEIDFQPKAAPGMAPAPARQLYRGWMFANAPGLHPFEHPVYDAWLIACKAASPSA